MHVVFFDRCILWIAHGKFYDYFSGSKSAKSRHFNGKYANIFKESSKFLNKRFFIENIDSVNGKRDWKKELAEKMQNPDISVSYRPADGDLWRPIAKIYVRLLSMILVTCVLTIGFLLGF